MSEFVFGTHNAAFVQVMYEQWLQDPTSVGQEWRELFENGKLAQLPVIPVPRETGNAQRETQAPSTLPVSRSTLPAGAAPITGPAARLVSNMTDSLSVPTATSFRDISANTLDARRKALNAQLASGARRRGTGLECGALHREQ